MGKATPLCLTVVSLLYLCSFTFVNASFKDDPDQMRQNSGSFAGLGDETIKQTLEFCNNDTCLNLSSTCKRFVTIADQYLSTKFLEITVKELNTTTLLKFLQTRTPFQNLTLIKEPQASWLEMLEKRFPPIEFTNTTLHSLSLQVPTPLFPSEVMGQLTSLCALTALNLTVGVKNISNLSSREVLSPIKQDFYALTQLTILNTLSLINMLDLGEHVDILSNVSNLTALTLNNCGIQSFNFLKPLTRLTSINFAQNLFLVESDDLYSNKPIEEAQIEPLLGLTNLKEFITAPQELSQPAMKTLRIHYVGVNKHVFQYMKS